MPTPATTRPHAALTACLLTLALPPRMLRAFARSSARNRLSRLITLTLVGGLSVMMALILLNTLLVVYFWESHRLGILTGLTVLYAMIGVVCLRLALVRAANTPLSLEICELVKEWRLITPRASQWINNESSRGEMGI